MMPAGPSWIARLRLLIVLSALLATSVCAAAPRGTRGKIPRLRGRAVAIDMGSNGVKLIATNKRGKVVYEGRHNTALGAGVGADKLLPVANQKRAKQALGKLMKDIAKLDIPKRNVSMIATAAVRNATGRPALGAKLGQEKLDGPGFLAQLGQRFAIGGDKTVLTGRQEAEHGYRGALLAWSPARLRAELGHDVARLTVIDTGGGSHQVSTGTQAGISAAGSTQIGSQVVRDKVFIDDAGRPLAKLNARQLAAADQRLAKLLTKLPVPTSKLQGSQPLLTGGFSKLLRVYFGRDHVTAGEIRALRSELASRGPKARRDLLWQRVQSVRKDAAHGKTALSPKDIEAQLVALGFVEKKHASKGGTLAAKATLVLRVLELAGFRGDSQIVLLSGTDARHAMLAR